MAIKFDKIGLREPIKAELEFVPRGRGGEGRRRSSRESTLLGEMKRKVLDADADAD